MRIVVLHLLNRLPFTCRHLHVGLSMRTACSGREGCPQMQRCVGTPRPPALRACEQLCGCRSPPVCPCQRSPQANISRGKGIGFAQLTHGNVLCGPCTHPRQCAELANRLIKATAWAKDPWI